MNSTEQSRSERMAELLSSLSGLEPLTPPDEFIAGAGRLDIAFEAGDLDRLGRYLAMLLHVGRHMNLTAVKDAHEAWMRHVLDSLTLVPIIGSAEPETVMDVGSGGGLPGLVLAAVMPEVAFTLLEATGKKAAFLRAAAEALALNNVKIVNDRAESIGHDRDRHREKYKIVTARAVGRLPVLLELTVPLAAVGGYVLAVKGERAQQEIDSARQALHLLHSRISDTVPTPTGTIVLIEKQRRTPKIYPRRPGEPKRAPLGGRSK